ncbi:Cholesterol transporter ABCA5 [Halotydeus destructor]|nr:Cholesterol transporter ABCA5 [Halotydeus destructor]
MSTLAQLKVLINKNLSLRKTQPLRNVISECCTTIVLVGILIVGHFSIGGNVKFDSEHRPLEAVEFNQSIEASVIIATERNGQVALDLRDRIIRSCRATHNLQASSEDELIATLQDFVDGESNSTYFLGGVHVEVDDQGVKMTVISTEQFVTPYFRATGSKYAFGYQNSGSNHLLSCSARAILNATNVKMEFKEFPYIISETRVEEYFPIAVIIGLSVSVYLMLVRITNEIKSGTKQYFYQIGLKPFAYWTSHFVDTSSPILVSYFLLSVLNIVPLPWPTTNLFANANTLMVFMVLVVYTLSSLLFAMALTVHYKSKLAVSLFLVYSIITILLPENVSSGLNETPSFRSATGIPVVLCLLPNMALKTFFSNIQAIGRQSRDGASWFEVFSKQSDAQVTARVCLIMMIVSMIISIAIIMLEDNNYFSNILKGLTVKSDRRNSRSPNQQSQTNVITVRNVDANFTDPVCTLKALRNVSFKAEYKKLTVILGPYKSGKSSLVDVISGNHLPSSGSVLLGQKAIRKDAATLALLSTNPQETIFYDELTIQENLQIISGIKGIPKSRLVGEIAVVLQLLKLTDKKKNLVKDSSSLTRRKLAIAVALLGGRKIIVINQLMDDMDGETADGCWSLLKRLSSDHTVIVTTTSLSKASQYGDEVIVLVAGQVRSITSGSSLKNTLDGKIGYELEYLKGSKWSRAAFEKFVHHYIPAKSVTMIDAKTKFIMDIEHRIDNHTVNKLIKDSFSRPDLGASFINETVFNENDMLFQLYPKTPQIFHTVRRQRKTLNRSAAKMCYDSFRQIVAFHMNNLLNLVWLLVPIAILFSFMACWDISIRSASTEWRKQMKLDQFNDYDTATLLSYRASNNGTEFQDPVAAYYDQISDNESKKKYILANATEDFIENHIRALRGKNSANNLHVGSTISNSDYTIWYNRKAVHSQPISLSMVYRAIHLANVANATTLELTNHALDQLNLKKLFIIQPLRPIYAIFFSLIVATITTFQSTYPRYFRMVHSIATRTNSLATFWIPNTVFDCIVYTLIALMALFISEAFGLFFTNEHFTATFISFIVAMIPFTYVLTHMTKNNPELLFLIICTTGIVFSLMNFYADTLIASKYIDNIYVIYTYKIFALGLKALPHNGMISALNKMAHFSSLTEMCPAIPKGLLDKFCQNGRAKLDFFSHGFRATDILKCCQESCSPHQACLVDDASSVFTFGRVGIMTEMMMLLISSMAYWVILWRIEKKLLEKKM